MYCYLHRTIRHAPKGCFTLSLNITYVYEVKESTQKALGEFEAHAEPERRRRLDENDFPPLSLFLVRKVQLHQHLDSYDTALVHTAFPNIVKKN